MTRFILPFRRPSMMTWLLLPVLGACDVPGSKPVVITQLPPEEPVAVALPAGGLPPRVEPRTVVVPSIATVVTAADARTLGLEASRRGRYRDAVKAFDRAIALEPGVASHYIGVARALLDWGRPGEAAERATYALTIDSSSTEALRLLARAQAKQGLAEQASETYRRALVMDDNDVWTLNNYGSFFLEQGEPSLALGPLARAVQLRSTSPVFQNNLGVALERAGHPVSAKRAYEAAVRADSGYANAVANLARVTALVGDSTEPDGADLTFLAELFRLEVGMWRDSMSKTDSVETVQPAVDMVPMVRDTADVRVP